MVKRKSSNNWVIDAILQDIPATYVLIKQYEKGVNRVQRVF